MKNQKIMFDQKFFRQKIAKPSKQHFLAIVVKPISVGIWAILRLQCKSPMVMTFQGATIGGNDNPMSPITGQRRFSDGPSLIMKKILEMRSNWGLTCSCGKKNRVKWDKETEGRVASSAEFKNQTKLSWRKYKQPSRFNRLFFDREGSKQFGMVLLVNKTLRVTSRNLLNEGIPTLTVTKRNKFKSRSTPTGVESFRIRKKQSELSVINVHAPHTCEKHPLEKNLPNWWFLHWFPENFQRILLSKTNVAGVNLRE